MEEIEVKFLDIDVEEIQRKLEDLGAKKVGEYFYRRRLYDYPDLRLYKEGAWIRLRDEGKRVTLAYKQRLGIKAFDGETNDDGMKEIEVEVSDFDKTAELMVAMGFKEKFYQENRRIRWIIGDTEFDIDFWPQIKPYLEIEAQSWEDIDKSIQMLGLDPNNKKIFSAGQIFKMNGIDENEV